MITHPMAHLVFKHLAGKWSQRILQHLAQGEQRFSQLRRVLPGVSEKMLVQTLRELERDGLLRRTSFPVVPPHVVYSLTDAGGMCVERAAPLAEFLEAYVPFFERARISYDNAGC